MQFCLVSFFRVCTCDTRGILFGSSLDLQSHSHASVYGWDLIFHEIFVEHCQKPPMGFGTDIL